MRTRYKGSFIIEELTDLVEEAVLTEFDRITERGGVLGAMETMYQRGKIQEESLYYEIAQAHGRAADYRGQYFSKSKEGSPTIIPSEVIRATKEEKEAQITSMEGLHKAHVEKGKKQLQQLQQAAISNQNIFESLMEATKYCSLGQITHALYAVGGQYRRNM
jgi:methylmalonyl-CoA mutase